MTLNGLKIFLNSMKISYKGIFMKMMKDVFLKYMLNILKNYMKFTMIYNSYQKKRKLKKVEKLINNLHYKTDCYSRTSIKLWISLEKNSMFH